MTCNPHARAAAAFAVAASFPRAHLAVHGVALADLVLSVDLERRRRGEPRNCGERGRHVVGGVAGDAGREERGGQVRIRQRLQVCK